MKKPARKSRRDKVQENFTGENTIHRKAQTWGEQYGLYSIKLTEAQQELAEKIQDNTLTFVDAPAGTGKSMSVLHTYLRDYLKNTTRKLVIVRTPVEAGMDKIGALPNGYMEKVDLHFSSTRILLEQLLSKSKVENDLEHRILFEIPNFALGKTFDNCDIFLDEAQQLPPNILKLLLERIGVNSRCVVAGDSSQLYTSTDGKRNGLKDALPRFFDKEMNPKFEDIAFHKFTVDQVMRSEIVKTVIRAYGQ